MIFDFSLLLVVATMFTGAVALIDTLFFAKKRNLLIRAKENELITEIAKSKRFNTHPVPDFKELRKKHMPILVDYSRSLFPVLFVVLVIRSFFFEPYQIPSGSMLPTLRIGDFILVDKFSFGVRLPVINTKILSGRTPQPGDVLVFRAPFEPHSNFIKRVVGIPGDRVEFRNNVLYINDRQVPQGMVKHELANQYPGKQIFLDTLGEHNHLILKNLSYSTPDGQWTVPKDSYFVLGDNRGNSHDSRFWGFVPDDMIIGRAIYVWMHWNDFFSLPSFSNVGSIDENI